MADGSYILQPVIICGGAGSRLWPMSREHFPKQLLTLIDDKSLLQNTILRLTGLACETLILVSNENHRFLVAEQLREIGANVNGIILEPTGRNTAPAVAVAAIRALESSKDPILLVLPADHVIGNVNAFQEAVLKAAALAQEGELVTFGITPTAPETGYGYIQKGDAIGNGYRVHSFVEKPLREVAESYLASGEYFWNSGVFVFKASRYLEELDKYEPEILDACRRALEGASRDVDFIRLNKEAFLSSPDNSVDYAIMEKTDQASMVPLNAAWSDVGSFSALWDCSPHDDSGNYVHGDVILENSHNCYVNASERLVTVVGATDLVIVETADAVLVAPRGAAQDVKKIVAELKRTGREEHVMHRCVYRPWGHYEGVDQGERYQVKRIVVKPGAALSLQMHHHRAEHWIVVSGTAEVTCEDRVFLVAENESTFIPLGHKHRLRNPGKKLLEIVEVQSGSYLGEDDIVRFEDKYGRN